MQYMADRFQQSMNEVSAMYVIVLGKETDVKLLQSEKVPHQIEVTPSGIVTEIRLLQPIKAPVSIAVTPYGIITEIRLLQFAKAYLPIASTDEGIVTYPSVPIYATRWCFVLSK